MGSASDAPFDVFPRISARGIAGIAFRVFGEKLVMPRWRFDRVGLASDLIPQLLDEEKFFGRGEPFDLGGKDSVHVADCGEGKE